MYCKHTGRRLLTNTHALHSQPYIHAKTKMRGLTDDFARSKKINIKTVPAQRFAVLQFNGKSVSDEILRCVYVYMYIYVYLCMHVCVHRFAVLMQKGLEPCTHTYIHAYIHAYINTYIIVHTHIHLQMQHTYIHTRTLQHTYIHTYIHTYRARVKELEEVLRQKGLEPAGPPQ
jgi:hypothetical protein